MSNPNGLEGRILILGDETKSARAIERLLAASGYAAHYLTSFETARQQVTSPDIALVIIEPSASRLNDKYYEPSADDSGDGLRRIEWAREALCFCEETKSNRPNSELPILVISKSQRTQDKVACLNRGVTDYLTRPYQRAELLSRVRSHVRAWRNERERTERFEQLNVFHAVSSVLTSSLEPDVLLEGTLSVLVNHLSVDAGVVYLRNADTLQMSIVAAEGFSEGESDHTGLLDLHSRIAPLMQGQPLVLEPLPDSAKKGIAGDVLANFHGLVCAPIGLKGNIIGAICLFSNKESAFPRQQSALLSTICNQLSVAIENARLYVETKKSAAQLSFVYNLGNNLMTSLEMDELLGYAVFSVGKSVACDVCAVV
ncbi:MAG TPA: GAF domain-containing protein, partial [Blastocatellia bacterium]|nr:GAF domain-containing protein [Blastocatellia bacterium]